MAAIHVLFKLTIIIEQLLLSLAATSSPFNGTGTNRDIKEIFLGRCAEYTTGLVNPHVDPEELRSKNCTRLWNLFYDAFAYKQPCNVTSEMYKEFVEEASLTTPANKALFWDGWDMYNTVRAYDNEARRATSLEFLLVGYLINQLTFCGQEQDPGLNFDVCPDWGQCGFAAGAMDGFWATASQYFGRQANGNIKFMVNSNRKGGAFQVQNSYFTNIELVSLNTSKVTRMDIYLVTFLGESPDDTCKNGTILELMKRLRDKGIQYECFDQPKDVLHLLCADNVDDEECVFLSNSMSHGTSIGMEKQFILVTMVIILLLLQQM